jgi:hypothetical protein
MDESTAFPSAFYISFLIWLVVGAFAWKLRDTGIGIPMGVVLGTIGIWYFGDAIYNDYSVYVLRVGTQYLDAAWWQVALFVGAFGVFAPVVHRMVNSKLLGQRSQFLYLMQQGGIANPEFQRRLDVAARLLITVWVFLMLIALYRTDFNFMGLFVPFASGGVNPWSRGRVGGEWDALVSFAGYLQVMITAALGIVAAISKNRKTRITALVILCLSLPSYFLGRTRSKMLAVALPGFLAWILLRLRGGLLVRFLVVLVAFFIVEGWMKFVVDARSKSNIALLFSELGVGGVVNRVEEIETPHAGLNMFEELALINSYIDKGTYQINMGQRYFAELVNPIPRGLCKDKPMIGIDYAIARGQLWGGQREGEAGVGATISTGMIGQGVVNFGTFFGILAAAFLMAFWVAILARQDLKGEKMGRMLLFFIGCVLTFNMGRDVTLLVLYPFVFGYILLNIWGKFSHER